MHVFAQDVLAQLRPRLLRFATRLGQRVGCTNAPFTAELVTTGCRCGASDDQVAANTGGARVRGIRRERSVRLRDIRRQTVDPE